MTTVSKQIVPVIAAAAFLSAVLVLASWSYLPLQQAVYGRSIPVRFNTGFCLLLSAVALFLLDHPNADKRKKLLVRICSSVVLLLILLTLYEYIFNVDLGIDLFSTKAALDKPGILYPGRMTLLACFILMLLNIACILRSGTHFPLMAWRMLITGFIILSLLFLVRISSGNNESFLLLRPSSIQTSITLLLLYIGTFYSYPFRQFRFSFEKRMIVYFSVVILLLLVVFLSFQQTGRRYADTARCVEETNETIQQNQHILLLAEYSEDNVNAYMISANDSYLHSFHQSIDSIHTAIDQLRKMTRDNAKHQRRIDSIRETIDSITQLREQLIAIRKKEGFATALQFYITRSLHLSLKTLQRVINEIVYEETKELEKHKAVNQQSIAGSSRVIIVFQTISVLLLFAIFFIIYTNSKTRSRSEQEIKLLNGTLDKKASELQSSNIELERFAYIASHDLQEPLRMVNSFLHLLEKKLDGKLDDSSKQYIGFAMDGSERMKKLIEDLLLYSRVGTSTDAICNVDCNEVVAVAQSMLALSIRETNATLYVGQLPVIKAVRSQILQLFQNLLSNALKYRSNTDPVIDIGCKDKGDMWEFFVNDNGIGIDPKFFDKIFVVFQRLHTKAEYPGTGIGLSICKKIIEKHGGTIRVESRPGNGTAFYFTIPKTNHS